MAINNQVKATKLQHIYKKKTINSISAVYAIAYVTEWYITSDIGWESVCLCAQ